MRNHSISVQALGQREISCLPCREGTVLTPGHPCGSFFPTGTARCREDGEELVGHRDGDLPAQTRLGVVDASPQAPQRVPHLEAQRERLHPLRLQRLRLGSGPQRLRRGPGFLGDARPERAHHLQGVEGGALRNSDLPSGATRKTSSTPRRQPVCHRRPHTLDVEVTYDDVRAAASSSGSSTFLTTATPFRSSSRAT